MAPSAVSTVSYSSIVNGGDGCQSLRADYASKHQLLTPPPTTVTLAAALLLLDTPLFPRAPKGSNGEIELPKSEECVFLMTRSYLQNWVTWAFHQQVPEDEAERVKTALRLASSIYKLTAPSYDPNSYSDPGPIDATSLSVLGHPLLLRPRVAVTPRAVENGKSDDVGSSTLSAPAKLEKSHSFSDLTPAASEEDNGDRKMPPSNISGEIECCAVPERFYELLRSIHGVLCEDGFSVAFQPFDASGSNTVVIHHHVLASASKNESMNRQRNGVAVAKEGMDQPQPVEFRRHVLFVLAYHAKNKASTQSPIAKLLNEEMYGTPRVAPVVELYPMKVFYSFVGGHENGSSASPLRPVASGLKNDTIEHSTKAPAEAEKTANGSGKGSERFAASSAPSSPKASDDRPPLGTPRETGKRMLPTLRNSKCVKYPPSGFVLVSRTSLVVDALQALMKEIVPEKSSTCVRLWIKRIYEEASDDKRSLPTAEGDGYEVIQLDSLDGKLFPKQNGAKQNGAKAVAIETARTPEKSTITVSDFVRRQAGENAKTISILIETREHPSSKWTREALELENRFKVGDFVDAQDVSGKWFEAIVRKVSDETVFVHYAGWASRWDTSLRKRNDTDADIRHKKIRAPAPLWTHTNRWRENIKAGDAVEVRESSSIVQRPRWFRGIVRSVGKENDDVRDLDCGAELEALEVGTDGVKRPLLVLQRKRQVLVEVSQEKNNNELTLATNKSAQKVDAEKQSPFLRWMNLYGEEICESGTHLEVDKGSKRPATLHYLYDTSKAPVEVLKSFNGIHGAGFVRESLRGVPPAPGSVGLHNLGNSCFLNSIVQCLNHIEPLTQYFLKGNYIQDLNKKNPLGSGGRVAIAYASLLNDMWGGEYSTLAPRTLKQTVGFFAPQFNNVYQHDSQEFCSFLMDGIHEDLNRVRNKPYVEELEGRGMRDEVVAMESWKKHLLRHDSVIVDHCQGMHRSHLTCPLCGRESVKFDVYSTISLPLPPDKTDSIDLQDCLEMFTVGEQLDEHNAWYCPGCKKHVCALKMIALWSVPDILILHLKRFTFDTCKRSGGVVRSKVEDTVNFPIENLDMSKYILGPTDEDAPPVYKLFGVSEHSGSTANSGHYTATVRNSRDGKWYRYNDSHVGSTSGEASVTGGAYLLFYQRSKGSARWAGMEKVMINRGMEEGAVIDEDGFTEVKSKKKHKKKMKESSSSRRRRA